MEAHFVGAQDVDGGEVREGEEQRDEHCPVVKPGIVQDDGARVEPEGDDYYCGMGLGGRDWMGGKRGADGRLG